MSHFHFLARRTLLALGCAFVTSAALAAAGELTVVSEPSMKGVLTAAAQQFEKESGQHVVLLFVKPRQLASAFTAMDHPDLLVLPDDLMDKAMQGGHVQADTRRLIGQAGLALVVRRGADRPEVSTPEALKQVLGRAKSIVYGDPDENSAGAQAVQLLTHLGLVESLKGKTTLASGANPMAQVSLGASELGLQSLHEALEADGVTVISPLPAAVQPWRRYVLALTAEAPNLSDAKALAAFLAGGSGRQLLEGKGLVQLP